MHIAIKVYHCPPGSDTLLTAQACALQIGDSIGLAGVAEILLSNIKEPLGILSKRVCGALLILPWHSDSTILQPSFLTPCILHTTGMLLSVGT